MNYVISMALVMYLLGTPSILYGQVGDCEPAQAEAYLDAGNVRALIFNNGGLFFRQEANKGIYEVPKGEQVDAIFGADLLIAGLIDNELHAAAARFVDREFWPGPLDENGMPPSDCSAYDRIWEIRRSDIEQYLNDGSISENMMTWPWHLGAPVVDGDGNPDNYNIDGGDLPELLGDQRLWWIMNDRGNVHVSTESLPIGLEVHGSAFAFNHPLLGQSTFYRFKVIYNRSSTFDEVYTGLFLDPDLGDLGDDYVGADTLLNMGYTYNAQNVDSQYGVAAPAIGFVLLNTAPAEDDLKDNDRDGEVDEPGEQIGMTALGCAGFFDWPDCDLCEGKLVKENYYNCMQGKTGGGRDVYEGFEYPPEGEPTPFYYPGDPVERAFWSELNINKEGLENYLGDRNFAVASGPFSLAQKDTLVFDLGIVWSRGLDHIDSVVQLRKDVTVIRDAADVIYAPLKIEGPLLSVTPSSSVLGFDQNFPNPFTGSTSIRYSLPKQMDVRLTVYDMLGREIEVLVERIQDEGVYTVVFDGTTMPQGIYFARLELDHLQFTQRMVLIR